MSPTWVCTSVDETQLTRIAELIALKVRVGDLITLTGDLGAGKTTFARALIRALLDDPAAEVPSPTFTLVQSYATSRIEVAHFDLYRLNSPDELDEVGFDDAVAVGVVCGGPMERGGEHVSPLNIPAWRGFPLRGRVAEYTGLPTFVDGDAKALALGEGWLGAARGGDNYRALVASTGGGGGIVLAGFFAGAGVSPRI